MLSYKFKILFLILLGMSVLNYISYSISESIKQDKINAALKQHLSDLQIHYEILLYHQNITAETAYEATVEKPGFMELFSKVSSSSKVEQELMRKDLELLLSKMYARLQKKGVLQYHFVLPDNTVFLRMHKLDKFGDDLTSVRKDFKYVNETKCRISGFTQGRTAHGFRNVFPIFDENGVHLGAMEISFSSDEFIKYLRYVSKIHTRFLVNKEIFDTNAWSRDDVIPKYTKSHEHKDFMVTSNNKHSEIDCFQGNEHLIDEARDEINAGIKIGEKFSILLQKDDQAQAVSFLPIKSLDGQKSLAWFVSYVQSDFISSTLQSTFVIRIIGFFIILLLGVLSYISLVKRRTTTLEMEEKAYIDGLTGVYNRNKFDKVFEYELLRSQRYKHNFCIALVDIDHFKIFNDTYGHLVGDEVLIMLAQHLSQSLRDSDTFARWGGEEFVILFPQMNIESAKKVCEKLRKSVEELKHAEVNSVTVSMGITSYAKGDTLESIFKRCDDALYKAKENGRNQVSVV